MKIIIEINEGQFANGQVSRDLRVNSKREWQRRGSQLMSEQIDADERLPGYLREPYLPRLKSRRTRNFAKQRVNQGDPLSVLPSSQTNAG